MFLGAPIEVHGGPFSQTELAKAMAVRESIESDLMSLQSVHGVGIGEMQGKPAIVIFVDEEGETTAMPAAVDGIPTIVKQTGRFEAHQINLGTSGGNDILCSGYCYGGTVGFKVCDNTTPGAVGWIGNNHVVVSGCPGKCPNLAPLGTKTFSPGLDDNTPVCTTTGATNVGTLDRFIPIHTEAHIIKKL